MSYVSPKIVEELPCTHITGQAPSTECDSASPADLFVRDQVNKWSTLSDTLWQK
jgi:hypothetical protein